MLFELKFFIKYVYNFYRNNKNAPSDSSDGAKSSFSFQEVL